MDTSLRAPARVAATASCDVTLLLPCLNERATLPGCIAEAREARALLRARGYGCEILVADNGSDDGSQQCVRELGERVVVVPARGYGNALIGGCRAARGRFIVMADADGSYDLRECLPLVELLAGGDSLAMGTRLRGRILDGAMPWRNRYIGNPALSGILNLLFRSGLSDAHCGLRAITREAFLQMDLRSPGMELASEMVLKAARLGLERSEHPVTLRPDGRGRPPHLRPWRDGWRHLRLMLLLGPSWLFVAPGLAMALSGLLLAASPGIPILRGSMHPGGTWIVLTGASAVLGYQLLWLGLRGHALKVSHRLARPPRLLAAIQRWIPPQRALLLGGLGLLVGVSVMGWVVDTWAARQLGPLGQSRAPVAASMLLACSFLTALGGFLLSTLGRSQHGRLDQEGARTAWKDAPDPMYRP